MSPNQSRHQIFASCSGGIVRLFFQLTRSRENISLKARNVAWYRHRKLIPTQIQNMTLRAVKLIIVLLLGFVLAWQGLVTVSAHANSDGRVAQSSCCCSG